MALTMLVTLDGSEWGEGILDTAVRMATETHAKVYLLRVFSPVHDVGRAGIAGGPEGRVPSAAYAGVPPPQTNIREVETATQAAARGDAESLDYLTSVSSRFTGVEVECLTLESPHPADEIVQMAAQLSVDLIAMATHGRSGLAHVLLGSVAEAVVRSSKCPVLLYRPPRS